MLRSEKKNEIDPEKSFTIIWEIENPKYFRHLLNELYSPAIILDVMEKTGWKLLLYRLAPSTRIYATLKREKEDSGPIKFDLSYNFDITPLGEAELESKPLTNTFQRNESGPGILLCTDDGIRSCNCFQPQQITIRCIMKNKFGAISRSGQCIARTVLGKEDFKFVGKVEHFSHLTPRGRRNLKTLSTSTGQLVIDLILAEENGDDIEVVITPTREKSEYVYMLKSSLLDCAGSKTNIRTYNIRSQQKIQKLKVGVRKSDLLRNTSQFLPKDTLSMFCEITIKTGIESEKIEKLDYESDHVEELTHKMQFLQNRRTNLKKTETKQGSPFSSFDHDSKSQTPFPNRHRAERRNDSNKNYFQQKRYFPNRQESFETSVPNQGTSSFFFVQESKLRNTSPNRFKAAPEQNDNPNFSLRDALDDFTTFYKKGILCDTRLHTATKTFPAHKAILSARSPVFEAIFMSKKEEKIVDVRIDEVDEKTMRHFLFYLYSATLERLGWEDAKKLYFAADKYRVSSLKHRCTVILKQSINLSNCCDLLLMADMYRIGNLRTAVQNYIVRFKKEVFSSNQWREIERRYPHLAMDTRMHMQIH